ncbi:ABC transporter permease [Paenibacillus koleovorans]|uniref:ABC transporter permease n=1 Tax=Paenibacillus koleovorans TaxID=121608 RepID=UPI000FDA8F26|nr:ABC transporter permease subunit [Paenibacillus koleovorans]
MSSPVKVKAAIPKNESLSRIYRARFLILLLSPALIYYLLFEYLPMFGLVVAFKDYNVFRGLWESEWVGLKYFNIFFSNPDFWPLLRNTFLLGFYSLIWGFPAPIVLALLLNELRNSVFKRVVQTVSYLPHFLSNVVIASLIVMMLSPTTGLVNKMLGVFHIEPIYFLSIPEYFRTIYVASGIWQGLGWGAIIYLAALTTIDPHLYESADLDGAGRWRKMWSISLPGIVPVIIVLLILNIGSLFGIGFEKVLLLYTPMTYSTADILSTYTYRTGLLKGNFSYATAIGLFNGITSFILIYCSNYLARKLKETSLW